MDLLDASILIVDDDRDVLETARLYLKQKFNRVEVMEHPSKIIPFLEQADVDAILLDMNFGKGEMDGKEGLKWLKKIKSVSPLTTVLIITAYGDINLAVEAMREGASDFIVKPWKNEKLLGTINAALELTRSRSENERLKRVNEIVSREIEKSFGEIVGESPVMRRMYELIEKVGPTDANVLILGENGTGKELVARALHWLSARTKEVFLHIDIGSIAGTLFESELFGHVKGAFTDAKTDRAGCFELARGGSLFLDEIGNLSLQLQSKLLSAIQNREVRRVGSNKIIPIDVRLISATNMALNEMADKSKPEFRKDLLYRINTVEIQVPPLRERKDDIPLLANHYLEIYCAKYNKPGIRIEKSQHQNLVAYAWPGNVRELQHLIEKAVIMAEGKNIPDNVFKLSAIEPVPEDASTQTLEEMEKKMIERSVNINKGNLSKVAGELGITRATLYRKMDKFGLK